MNHHEGETPARFFGGFAAYLCRECGEVHFHAPREGYVTSHCPVAGESGLRLVSDRCAGRGQVSIDEARAITANAREAVRWLRGVGDLARFAEAHDLADRFERAARLVEVAARDAAETACPI